MKPFLSGILIQLSSILPLKQLHSFSRSALNSITLNSFIISNTRLPELTWWQGGMTKNEFEECHVLFQQEDKETYIKKILTEAQVD